ncbi:hypothetical protein N7474_008349 [Penicillium riverlandense]|uniref:uncharacterized protein n=1 Tax=Penicillium riverlandense TaxID=1903569 RepID=UPI0025498126|nr:uncharacterized protein N7474_008349 [Penicillium riverlandense]KAJ5812048.1 hypothetical protein N7474_008349 [Penicillium riverlandense]
MAAFFKKIKRKRRLSSELHSRWGDVAISYPTEGSWNQWNQPAGFAANSSPDAPPPNSQTTAPRGHAPMKSVPSSEPSGFPLHGDSAIPTGHFDERVRQRHRNGHKPSFRGLGVGWNGHEMSSTHENTDFDEVSCSEEDEEEDEDEERDTLDAPTRDHEYSSTRGDRDSYASHLSRSPPLSVTSRMRRCSLQSCRTEHSTVASVTASSRHTSYTAASSVSAPSMPPQTPRFGHVVAQPLRPDRKQITRPRQQEPELVAQQGMVPSYDELYG